MRSSDTQLIVLSTSDKDHSKGSVSEGDTSLSPASTSPLVKAEGVTRVYHVGAQEVHALRGVDLSIERGKLVALRGRSGSGKTTLLNIVGGLDRPTSGEVYFDGRPMAKLSGRQLTRLRRHRIGFVFQSFALLPTYSAYENVELLLRIAGLGRRKRSRRAKDSLRLVGLTRWMDHRPDEMSGGQQQRVAIARALATRPDLVLADEPTGELDTTTGRQIFALLRRVVEVEGITVLTVTHDPLIDEYANLVYELRDGRIMRDGATRGRVGRSVAAHPAG
jgi:ABC-type lipoprotein export system ATPase subunit